NTNTLIGMAVLSIPCRHPQTGSLCTAISNDAFKQKNLRVISRPLFRRLTSEKKCRTSKFPKLLRKRWYRPDASKGRSRRISERQHPKWSIVKQVPSPSGRGCAKRG